MSDDDDPEPQDGDIAPDEDAEQRRVERKRTRIERERDEEDKFWRAGLASLVGRRAIYRLLEQSGAWTQPFAVGPNGFPQPEATWFRSGENALARRMHDYFQILDHGAVYLMLRENHPAFKNAPPSRVTHG